MKITANIEYKSVLSEFKTIKERNYAFNHLDEQSQRLEIAWDALQLVLNKQLAASAGYYWSVKLQQIKGGSKKLQSVLNSTI